MFHNVQTKCKQPSENTIPTAPQMFQSPVAVTLTSSEPWVGGGPVCYLLGLMELPRCPHPPPGSQVAEQSEMLSVQSSRGQVSLCLSKEDKALGSPAPIETIQPQSQLAADPVDNTQ